MRLKHITFTGVDAKTDVEALREIQNRWPMVEFGVLTSYHWYENGNRYLDPRLFRYLTKAQLRLSLHVCGTAAHDAACGEYGEICYLSWGKYRYFQRIQLNVAERKDNPKIVSSTPYGHEVIIQQRNIHDLSLYAQTREEWKDYCGELSILLDASGGRGIDTELKILHTDHKIGYAGGFNPENVEDKLTYLYENGCANFWIDMESGVRTDDWFDIDKVVKVLEICKPIIERYDKMV